MTTISTLERILDSDSLYVNRNFLTEKLASTTTSKWVVQRIFDVLNDVIEILKCEHSDSLIEIARGIYESHPFRTGPLCRTMLTSCFLYYLEEMERNDVTLDMYISTDNIMNICRAIEEERKVRDLAMTIYDLIGEVYPSFFHNNRPFVEITNTETVILALIVRFFNLGATYVKLENFMLQRHSTPNYGFDNKLIDRILLHHTKPYAYIFLAENIKESVYRKKYLLPIKASESEYRIYQLDRPFGIRTSIQVDKMDVFVGIDFKITKTIAKWLIDIIQYYSIVFKQLIILKLTKLDDYNYNTKILSYKNYYDKEFIDAYLDASKCINDKTAEMKIEISQRIQSGNLHSFESLMSLTEYFFTDNEEEAEFKNARCLRLSCGHFLGLDTIKEWFISGASRCSFCNQDAQVECYFEHHVTTKRSTTVN